MQNPHDKKWEALPTAVEGRIGERSYMIRNRRHIRQMVGVTPRMPKEETRNVLPPTDSNTGGTVAISVPGRDMVPVAASRLLPNTDIESSPVMRTRSGRVVRKLERLDL